MLIKHGANVNANDLWAFTPLHEAASKSRVEVCSLLLSEGADPTQLNCHGKSAIDVAPTRELQERLVVEYRGHCLLEACRMADSARVKKLLSSHSACLLLTPGTSSTPSQVCLFYYVVSMALCIYYRFQQSVELRPASPPGGGSIPPAPSPSVPAVSLSSTSAVNFVHPFTGDTPLHCAASSVYPKRKQVNIAVI